MAQGQGIAKQGHASIWRIEDNAGGSLARFDHGVFSAILPGALVDYIDADDDGNAETVTPATSVAHYMERAQQGGALQPEAEEELRRQISVELLAAGSETGRERQKRLRRLRDAIDQVKAQ